MPDNTGREAPEVRSSYTITTGGRHPSLNRFQRIRAGSKGRTSRDTKMKYGRPPGRITAFPPQFAILGVNLLTKAVLRMVTLVHALSMLPESEA